MNIEEIRDYYLTLLLGHIEVVLYCAQTTGAISPAVRLLSPITKAVLEPV